MPSQPIKSKEEKDFEAEDDARTLMRAEEIRNDKGRMKRAKGKLDKMRQQATEAAQRKQLEAKVAKKLKEA